MAVLSGPPPGHVRAAGEAIAIVDPDGTGAPPKRGRDDRVAVATAGAVLVLAASLFGTIRSADTPARASLISAAPSAVTSNTVAPSPTDLRIGWWTYLSPPDQLTLPLGTTGVDLWAMPDRLVNEPPDARLRVLIHVRGTSGLAAVDFPAEIAWTEDGSWYQMRSRSLTIAQLIDIASALR